MELTTINSQQNQTMLDIALQEHGSIEALFDFMEANNFSIVSEDPSPYDSLKLEGDILDRAIYNYYKNNNIIPATAVIEDEICFDGIGCMTLEDDFYVR